MKNINKAILGLIFGASCGLLPEGMQAAERLDTIDYRVFIAVDRPAIEHWGGETAYREKLDEFFGKVNKFWNEAGEGRFKYYFRYLPDLQMIYNGSSDVVEKAFRSSTGYPEHDVLMIIDSKADHDDEHPGWYCGGASDDLSLVVCRGRSKTEPEDLFGKDYFYKGVAHELGHYRGVTDLYADRIRANNNPVNGLEYEPEACVMNSHYTATRWSDYAADIINYTALYKRPGKECPGFFHNMFPQNFDIKVTVKGKPKKGVKINLYGSRAKFNDLIPVPYRTYVTGKDGKVFVTDVPDLYDQPERPINTDELPYNRWFTFVLEAEYKGEKKYVWLPEYEVQRAFFKGEKTYSVDVKF